MISCITSPEKYYQQTNFLSFFSNKVSNSIQNIEDLFSGFNQKDTLFSENSFTYKIDTRNFLNKIELHSDYPKYTDLASATANDICKALYDKKNLKPSRIANSIEGGIAVVYGRRYGFLKRKYREIFIEVYNNGEANILYSEDYKLKKIDEVDFGNKEIVFDYISYLF